MTAESEEWVRYSAAAAELGVSVPRFHVLAIDEGFDIRKGAPGEEGWVSRRSIDEFNKRARPSALKGMVQRVWRAVRWLP